MTSIGLMEGEAPTSSLGCGTEKVDGTLYADLSKANSYSFLFIQLRELKIRLKATLTE